MEKLTLAEVTQLYEEAIADAEAQTKLDAMPPLRAEDFPHIPIVSSWEQWGSEVFISAKDMGWGNSARPPQEIAKEVEEHSVTNALFISAEDMGWTHHPGLDAVNDFTRARMRAMRGEPEEAPKGIVVSAEQPQ